MGRSRRAINDGPGETSPNEALGKRTAELEATNKKLEAFALEWQSRRPSPRCAG